MKILLLADITGTGGIQEFSRGLLKALRRDGLEAAVLDRGRFSKIGFSLRALAEIMRRRADVILFGHINFSPLARIASFWSTPYAVFLYGVEAWDIDSSLQIRALKKAKLILAASAYTQTRAMEKTGLPADRFFHLPPFVDGGRFAPRVPSRNLLDRWGLHGKKIVLTVARLSGEERYKGYDTVIRSMPAIMEEEPDARYVLVGDGDDAPRVRELVAELGLQDMVIMPGRVDAAELVEYYNICDVFAMPSSGEGFGIVFLEALACGKPVVAGDFAGSREAVLEGRLGLLVEPGLPAEVARAILRCLQGDLPDELKDPGELRRRALDAYGADAFNGRVREFVSKLRQ